MNTPANNSFHAAALRFLHDRIDFERSHMPDRNRGLTLDRMRELLGRLGNPQDSLAIIHLTGTKGKGSTAAMIASVLQQAGRRTGLYTSPHLECVEERIAIDGVRCTENEFAGLIEQLRAPVEAMDREAGHAGGHGPTFFEITTAMAFLHFAQSRVDAAVVEVGMGGRLDSTNVCRPILSVITTISFDHVRQLGHSLAAIAGEKAGIIKAHVPLVSGVVDAEPREVIAAAARAAPSPLFELRREFDFEYLGPASDSSSEPLAVFGSRLSYHEPAGGWEHRLDDVTVGLPGRHQAHNAAVALSAVRRLTELGWQIPETAMRRGLLGVQCPARVEWLFQHPAVVLDVAHNVASVEALLAVLDERHPQAPRILIFGASQDKDIEGMLRLLVPHFETIILTPFINNPRSTPPDELAVLVEQISPAQTPANRSTAPARSTLVCQNPTQAWATARRRLTTDHLLCVTGSFFLAAEMRPILLESLQDLAGMANRNAEAITRGPAPHTPEGHMRG